MEIRELNVDEIIPYENNPRFNDGAVEAVANSIKEFGFKVPIIVDKDKVIIAGHTRLLASKRLGLERVPVIFADDLTEEQVKAFRIADNKVGEIATWDMAKLNEELKALQELEIDMSAFGFNPEELDNYEATDDDFNVDIAVQEIVIPKSKAGDVYQLGNHRLMCGDSTKAEDVKKLMDGCEADLVITDPPYNVNIGQGGGSICSMRAQNHRVDGLTIENDNMNEGDFYDFLRKAFENMKDILKLGGGYYIWYANANGRIFKNALHDVDLKLAQVLIWNKHRLVMGRQDYQWMHEPCLYGWKEGSAHYFKDIRTETTILKYNELESMTKEELIAYIESIEEQLTTDVISEARPNISVEHPTMKPVALIGRLVKNSSKPGELVVDLFGGSGSTLIACEQLERKCYMMEYDPKYVDVIIDRWEKETGKKAIKL